MSDRPTLTTTADGFHVLHFPEVNYYDTQVWSVDVGLSPEALGDLRDLLHDDAFVAHVLTDAARRMENAGYSDDAVAFLDLLASRQTAEILPLQPAEKDITP